MASPSIIPADRLDRDMHFVLEDFSSGPAWRETDEDRTDWRNLISDFLTGQYDHPLRVVAFNPLEGWSRDATEDVAQELERRVAEGFDVTEPVREFIERFTGRPIGVQLLRLRPEQVDQETAKKQAQEFARAAATPPAHKHQG